jgi:DNA-binding phage protein
VARRSEDWSVGLAKDLRDAAFAREFLLASIDEGVDLQLALGKVIRAMGVKEFAAKVRMASPNVLRAINPRHNPTQDTLNRLTRQELYDRVWAEPVDTLANEYGLSNVGLGKACRRHDIPVPPRGYWARKAAGQKLRRPPLPPRKDGDVSVTLWAREGLSLR